MFTSTLNNQLLPIYQQPLILQTEDDSGESSNERAELEAMLGIGSLIFQNIRRRHLAWYSDVQASRVPYDLESAEGFADEYRQWKRATEYWLKRAAELERAGHPLEHLADLRRFYEELDLTDLDVRSLRLRWEELEQGRGMEAGEFFASVRGSR